MDEPRRYVETSRHVDHDGAVRQAGNTKGSCLRPCQLSRSEQRSPLPRNTRRHGCCTALLGSQAKADLFQEPKLLVLAPDDLHDPLRVARRKRAPEAKRFQQPDDEPRCSKIRLLIAWFAVYTIAYEIGVGQAFVAGLVQVALALLVDWLLPPHLTY